MKIKNSVKRMKKLMKRLLLGMLACMLISSAAGVTAQAVNGTKNAVSHAIAIVFDNSGSMYENMAWCRATYAIEVFASMMNEGDVLQVYPMHEVSANGQTYTSETPVTISGGGDISVIRELYTPQAGGTPIETIGDAYSGLQKNSADEKWLIILTDGDYFHENGISLGNNTAGRLSETLAEYNQKVNVLYLGIGSAAVMPQIESNEAYLYYADKASNSADVLTKLTEMCNMIFGRDELPSVSKEITFDVSMKKLILFVQGDNIGNVTLKNSAGTSVGSPAVEYSPHYSEKGAGNYTFGIDKNLNGYIAVYNTELRAGTYSLDYSGDVSNVSVYYEPDVDLRGTLTDEYGAVMNASSELYPGNYSINYGLVDKEGNMTTSTLLGKTSYKVTYSVNGAKQTATSDESGQVVMELKEGDVLDGEVTVTYLSGYTITKDSSDFNWPSGGFKVVSRPAGLLELRLSGGRDTYMLSELGDTPYTVQLIYEGTLLTADKLAAADVSVTLEGGNASYVCLPDGNGYTLSLRYAGTAADTDCGDYTMHLTASYIDEFGVTAKSDEATAAFAIEDDGYGLFLTVDCVDYYVISQLDDCEAIKVLLNLDGEPLTDEQLAETALTVDASGLSCIVEPLYGESAYSVRIVGDDQAKSGKYTLNFKATTRDQVGREISDEGTKNIELSTYPLWLRFLVIALILLLIIALVLFYLSRKILPKKIGVNNAQTVFTVDGETVEGAAKCTFTGGGKKNGSIQVSTPHYSGSSLVNGGFTLTLQAISPRRIKSGRRRALVTNISPSNTAALTSLSVGTHTLVKSDEGDGVTWLFDSKQVTNASVTTKFEIGGKPSCTFMGETITGESFTLTVQLQFK